MKAFILLLAFMLHGCGVIPLPHIPTPNNDKAVYKCETKSNGKTYCEEQ